MVTEVASDHQSSVRYRVEGRRIHRAGEAEWTTLGGDFEDGSRTEYWAAHVDGKYFDAVRHTKITTVITQTIVHEVGMTRPLTRPTKTQEVTP